MSRWWIVPAFAAALAAQQTPAPQLPPDEDKASHADAKSGEKAPQEGDYALPPEEDKAKIPEQYSFNPLKSKQDVTVGLFYMKKGDYKAAAGRFREATKWNDGNADAWLHLGEAEEKNSDPKAASAALTKYLQLAPTAKNAGEVRKKLEKLRS